jgi:hypothetical protein
VTSTDQTNITPTTPEAKKQPEWPSHGIQREIPLKEIGGEPAGKWKSTKNSKGREEEEETSTTIPEQVQNQIMIPMEHSEHEMKEREDNNNTTERQGPPIEQMESDIPPSEDDASPAALAPSP